MSSCSLKYSLCLCLGRKSGKGVFIYSDKSKNRDENTEAMNIIKNYHLEPKMELVVLLLTVYIVNVVMCSWKVIYVRLTMIFMILAMQIWL